MKFIKFDMSHELLADLLFLPQGTKILALETNTDLLNTTFTVVVQSERTENFTIKRAVPVYRKEQVPSTVTMVDWNIEP